MPTIRRNICTVIFFQIPLFCYIKGLQLYPASDLTAQSFTLVCDLQGTAWTNTIIFTYNGSSGGGCGSPPNPSCGSPIGTISSDSQTVNLTLSQNEILSKGNALWVCAHGTELAPLNTTVIALCTNIEVKYADEKMDISCSCGFPSVQAELEYKDGQNGNTLGSQTFDLSSSPGTNCTTDIRAKDYSSKITNFPSGTVEVCATVKTYSQITAPKTKCELVPGLTTLSSAISSDMSTTVSEPVSTISSDMPATVSEVPPPPVTTSSAELSQEIVITIIISSSVLGAGGLILLIVLVLRHCRQKYRGTPAKNKENCFTTKQGNFTKNDASKSSIEPRKSKFSGKRNTKQESISLDKFKHTQFNNSQALKDRMYKHYPQTTDYMHLNNNGNQHVFNHSHAERNMILYGNRHHSYPKSQSRPNHKMVYLSPYPEHPGHYEGMFQYYRANNLYQGQQMYQRPCVAQYDHHIKDKPINERSFEGRTYERNWDFLY